MHDKYGYLALPDLGYIAHGIGKWTLGASLGSSPAPCRYEWMEKTLLHWVMENGIRELLGFFSSTRVDLDVISRNNPEVS